MTETINSNQQQEQGEAAGELPGGRTLPGSRCTTPARLQRPAATTGSERRNGLPVPRPRGIPEP
jgi:hypothetical protein